MNHNSCRSMCPVPTRKVGLDRLDRGTDKEKRISHELKWEL